MTAARQRILAAAAVYFVIIVAPTVAYDFPHPTKVMFNGDVVRLLGHVTVRQLLLAQHVKLNAGRLLDIRGQVLKRVENLPDLRVNGRIATSATKLKTGDEIVLRNGHDVTEPFEVQVLRFGAGNPQFLLGPGAITVKHGLRSAITLPVSTRPVAGPKAVALTFDDGPSPWATPQLLDVLKKKKVRATFFVVGRMAQNYPNLVRREVKEGHAVADHTWTHPLLARRPEPFQREEMRRTKETLTKLGASVRLFRPPYESYTPRTVQIASSLGMHTVIWSVDPADYRRPSPDTIVRRVLAKVKPGSIILMHDGGGDRSSTIAAVPKIIDILRKQGYSFETLD